MNVLFVINNLYTKGNGLCASARRTIAKLRETGLSVKTLAGPNPDPDGPQPEYLLQEYTIPVFEPMVRKQGFHFADVDKAIITEAVEWADVLHIEEPFVLQAVACKIAEEMGKPCVGTYHLHPENLFASAGLSYSRIFNDSVMTYWRNNIFNKCHIVQCPTENVRKRLKKWRFKSELRVISNGLVPEELFHPDRETVEKRPISNAKYQVVTIGRFAEEKDLITLLRAMKHCRYARDIQLVFAGRGPKEGQLKRHADKLVADGTLQYAPIFGFFDMEQLQNLAVNADLYIHCAYIEVEGLSCMEAIQTGIVPIIASGKLTATAQFALDAHSVFPARKPKQLAQRIDYWLCDDARRHKEAKRYVGMDEKYDIRYSITAIIKMYEDAIALHR